MSTARIGFFPLTMIVVSLVIGTGIFKSPTEVAYQSTSLTMFYLTWIVGGVIALCGALTYAEIGSRYPVTGGYYKVFAYSYHPALGFMINSIILISNAASMAAVALIGGEYINPLVFPTEWQSDGLKQLVGIGAILLFYGVNLLGLRTSATTQSILTVFKIILVFLLILAVFGTFTPEIFTKQAFLTGEKQLIEHDGSLLDMLKSFGAGLIAVCFTYGGYQQTINFGGETSNSARTLPRAIAAGIGIVIVLYLSVNVAYVQIIGFEHLKTSEKIATTMAGTLFGNLGQNVLDIAMFFSALAYVNVMLLSNPRVMYAMSEDKILPTIFAQRSQKTEAMVAGLTMFAAVGIITLFFSSEFETIVNYVMFLDSIGMVTSAATIFYIRQKTKDLDTSSIYSMPVFPLMPILFMLAYLLVATSVVMNKPLAAVYGLGIFLLMYPVYLLVKQKGNLSK